MTKIIALALFAITANVLAETGQTKYRCHTEGVADGGYSVRIEEAAPGKALADLSEITYFGSRPLATFDVKAVNQIDGVEFRDIGTDGRVFLLTIDFNSGSRGLNGSLRAEVNGRRIPPPELAYFGKLTCSAARR